NPKGFSYVLATVIMFVTLLIGVAIFEIIRLNIQAAAVRDKFEDAIIAMCVDNYAQLYQPVREGHAASYSNNGSGWFENNKANQAYIRNYLDSAMSSGEISQCNIVSIDFTVNTASLKPQNNTQTFAVNGTLTVQLPFEFLWADTVAPIDMRLDVKSKWRAKF
ncbi:MAG: hypothetical protein ACI4JS_10905, partial [Oscillospiraceae bacterium]